MALFIKKSRYLPKMARSRKIEKNQAKFRWVIKENNVARLAGI